MIRFRNWRKVYISTWLSWVMKLLMVGMIPYELFRGGYVFAVLIVVAVIASLVPSVVERNYNISLPFELDLLVTLSLFLHTFIGEGLQFYNKYWIWDKLLHLYGSAVIAIIAFVVVYSFHYTRKLRLTLPMIMLITFCFVMAMGALWEIGEFLVDVTFGKNAQKGLTNTMWDLINDLFGGVIVAVLGALYVKYSKPETRHRLAKPLGEVFGLGEKVDRVKERLHGKH